MGIAHPISFSSSGVNSNVGWAQPTISVSNTGYNRWALPSLLLLSGSARIIETLRISLPLAFGFGRCLRCQWIVGPVMFGITAFHILFNLMIRGLPEPGEVLRDLHRPVRR